jgi:hypothetical protein
MPRAALLSLHARVEGVGPSTWEDPSLAQLWGPRYSAYVVAERDFALFSLGRFPESANARLRAEGDGRAGARPSRRGAHDRRRGRTRARRQPEHVPVRRDDRHRRHPLGRRAHRRSGRLSPTTSTRARAPLPALLPSGDAYFLLAGAEREVLVPLEEQRRRLWPPRVWPGAVLVDGEIRGTWRRSQHTVRVDVWERLSRGARDAVKAEAAGLPLPGIGRRIEVVCNT